MPRAVAVLVGDHERRVGRDRVRGARPGRDTTRCSARRPRRRAARRRRRRHALAVARDITERCGRLGAHDRRRVVDRVHDDRRSASARRRAPRGRSRPRRREPAAAVAGRRVGGPNTVGGPSPGIARSTRSSSRGSHEVVALVLDVVAQHDVADAHAPQHGARRPRVGDALLEPAVERVQQVGRPAVPYGISSRATYGRSISPGVIGSTVLPHVYAAKSAPGASRTRCRVALRVEVPRSPASSTRARPRAARGSCRSSCRRTARAGSRRRAARRRPTTARAEQRMAAAPQRARTPRSRPRPSSTARPSTTSGTARAVLRSASPRRPSANDLNSAPSGDGSPYG